MIMGQTKLIHEHYDSKPWASIISATLLGVLAIIKLGSEINERSWFAIVLYCIIVLPSIVLAVVDIIWKKKPIAVIYNDRVEVRRPFSSKRSEILYSKIKNMALEAGQLRIWVDEFSQPSCFNMGANAGKAQESYDILHTAYVEYNQEHNFKPVPLWDLPKRKIATAQVVMIITMLCVIALLIILSH